MKILFYGSLFMIFYIYFGYPVLVYFISMFKNKKVRKGFYEPRVSVLIAAYNEEESIAQTIGNKLTQNYPREKMEIIVVSDGSTDKTDDIVKGFKGQRVKLIRQEQRSGKTAALNKAVDDATGEVLVFSDANSIYDPDTIENLVKNFSDPNVGYVTGKMIYTNLDGTPIGDGCTTYMKYENILRFYETKIGSIVGVDGGIDAIREKLYQPMNPDQLPDFILPLKVVEQGFRVVYEPEAILKERSLNEPENEYKMRLRVSLRSIWALYDMLKLLNFKKHGVFSWQLLSHKLLRYLCFIFLFSLYLSNLFLWFEDSWYKVFFLLQNAFYASAVIAYSVEKLKRHIGIFYLPYFFTILNLAAGHAFFKFILGEKIVTWAPRKG